MCVDASGNTVTAKRTKMKKPKITILPPAEDQEEFFQERQFDPELPGRGSTFGMMDGGDRGTDPIKYYNGKYPDQRANKTGEYASKAKQTKLRNSAKLLEGHPNKDAILKVLRTGLDHE